MKLLCLSNGHGEDAIAVQILRHLQADTDRLAALPLVGEGKAYAQLEGVPIVGPVRQMPSGGFVYMDGRQLLRDLRGGLLPLLGAQVRAVRRWTRQGGAILAVGDIVPLALAWLSGADYAFVGTAKSEYYLRDDRGPLSRQSWAQQWEGWSGSVYLPWERWLMSHPRCRAVFPRDGLTTRMLQKWAIPAFDLGNPMMDNLQPQGAIAPEVPGQFSLNLTLLPGSRTPEAYENWGLIADAVEALAVTGESPCGWAAIAPSLELHPFCQILENRGWQEIPLKGSRGERQFNRDNATIILTRDGFNDCLHRGEVAIAMAGTATEQFVGLGKPAIAIPGQGPQFTPAFAEAQSRLLGPSLIVAETPTDVAETVRSLLNDPERLQAIAKNGPHRLGQPGAARRIANCLILQAKN
ncbi:MAG: lipid-A-disaccharide synthase-related protein, partial [Limnospira sp.]